jgi:predicted dehydrogenase
MAELVRIGLVGLGKMGAYHLQKLLEHPQVELSGIYDKNPEVAQAAAQQFNLKIFSTPEDLFLESDAAIIASPTPTHHPLGKLALEAGIHVLIEKPLCDRVEFAEELVSIANQNQIVLQTGFVERYRLLEALREAPTEKPVFIASERCATSPSREKGLDVVTDLMIHDIDLVLYLLREPPVLVTAEGFSLKISEIDCAHARLEFASGAVAHLKANWIAMDRQRLTHVVYDDTSITIDLLNQKIQTITASESSEVRKHQAALKEIDALRTQLDFFVSAIQGSSKPTVSGLDGLRAIEVCEVIKQRIRERNNQQISVTPREKQFLTKVWGGHVN